MNGVSRMDYCEDVALVTLRKIPRNLAPTTEIFNRLGKSSVNIDMVSQTAPVGETVSISFTCLDSELRAVLDITKALRDKYPGVQSLVSSGNCKIHLFGEEMRTRPGVFARALSALEAAGAELQQITTSEVDISFLVNGALLEPCVQALQVSFGL